MLIFPPVVTSTEEDIPKNTQMPIGLAYIAAVLKKEGYSNIKILDAFTLEGPGNSAGGFKKYHGLSPESLRKEIEDFKPDIVGISSMYTMYSRGTHIVAEIARRASHKALVVCGGTHATINPQMLLQDKNIDLIVKGEGEVTFLEIVRAFENKKDVYAASGIIYNRDGQARLTPPRALIEDLDSLPFPERGYLPVSQYIENTLRSKSYNMRHPALTVVTSRGCPGRCIYCCVEKIWGRKWRARSAKNVVDEVELLIKQYGVREVQFTDDCISTDKNRLREICEELIRRRLKITWTPPAGIAIWQLNKELLRIMKRSGCYRLTFGLESGSQETLRLIGKHYSYEHARQIIKEAGRLGIWVTGTFIIGFPHETKAAIRQTIDFAIKSGLDFAVFYTPIIFPGTPLFDLFIKEGIQYDPAKTGTGRAYATHYATEEELLKIREDANRRFFLSRAMKFWRPFLKIRNARDFLYLAKVVSFIITNFVSSAFNKESAFGLLRESRVERGNG